MKKSVVVVLARGFEEIEAVTCIDVLRRAELDVTVAGVDAKDVEGAHGIRVTADVRLDDYKGSPDAVVLPGGLPGADNLKKSPEVASLLERTRAADKLIAAICAAPAVVLAPTGVLDGKRATCYPGFEKQFGPAVTLSKERVVRDGRVITSGGPGTALEFALALAGELAGDETARRLASGMLARV